MITLPKELTRALEAIHLAGGSPKLVGGTVRDHVLGIAPKDFDVEVSLLHPDTLRSILEAFGTVDVVGQQFGVFKLHGVEADFSIPRLENKIGAGHKDFSVTCDPNLSMQERSRRRDLTMNSMEMDPFTSEIGDPYNGLLDIKEGRMRATDPLTFGEDDLRAVRVAQFVSRFPNMIPDEELITLCSKANLSNLPGERLWEEFRKMLLKGTRPDLGLEFLKTANLLRFFPELQALVGCPQHPVYHAEGDVWVHTLMVVRVAATLRLSTMASDVRREDTDHDTILMSAALCHDLGKPPTTEWSHEKNRYVSNGHDDAGAGLAEVFLNRLKAPHDVIKAVKILVREHLKPFMLIKEKAGPPAYRRLARRMNGIPLDLLAKVANADSEGRICYDKVHQTREDINEFLRRATEAGVKGLAAPVEDVVKGRHLLARGMRPGPAVGEVLQRCREYYDTTGETDPEKILNEVLKSSWT